MIGVDRAAKQCESIGRWNLAGEREAIERETDRPPCSSGVYEYPFTTLKEGILWNALLTRWGEAGESFFSCDIFSR